MGLERSVRACAGLGGWVRTALRTVRGRGVDGLRDVGQDLYAGLWWATWPLPIGENVYDRPWDALIVLDACRVDLLRSVADEYAFLDGIDRRWSVGSMSKEWMAKTFDETHEADIERTAYITANVFSERMIAGERLLHLEEVWKDAWDASVDTVPPRAVTDRAVRLGRTLDPDRLIVHYVQPHHPFLSLDAPFDAAPFGPDERDSVVDALRKGKIDRDRFWEAYRENLRLVLDDVTLLLDNLDASSVVITADHGDALGEWGIYDHPVGFLHPAVRTVPWVRTSARDRGTYEPPPRDEAGASEVDVHDRLRALGYRS